ncbi:MAG: ParB/RepB/Spo0J family partition protein [Bacteroidota bacterium]
MQGKKKALGRGLSAILESPETDITSKDISGEYVVGAISNVRIELIETNPFQPRTHFSEAELTELSVSIQNQGIIQPITIRKMGYDKYQLISGERRLKASVMAGLTEIPAYIRIANDEQMLEMALVENIQRQDLNPIEIAISFQRLLDECNLKQEELSKKVGKDRSTVSNYIRLLSLPTEVQLAIKEKKITMGHARALITVPDVRTQLVILHRILENRLSVREVEEIVRTLSSEKLPVTNPAPKEKPTLSFKYQHAQELLEKKLNARVNVKVTPKGQGQIIIPFLSNEDFDRILSEIEA